ncbi:predicted protein [Lichtheimia corymbifera JMRC:FSU:9682]|uniref:Uncharacterized protein n=1 Tax=Lichtheimia corymbifera JMRC:FSU:9682 TaxID=1263082 RepID=A0A068S8L8_9FUNG|nr:predicted protein [Lichtheimia corymbifera JMRC:FSU:9682]
MWQLAVTYANSKRHGSEYSFEMMALMMRSQLVEFTKVDIHYGMGYKRYNSFAAFSPMSLPSSNVRCTCHFKSWFIHPIV